MGTTTFSGPIKAGTIKETTGTTLGTNIKNTGQVVMSQTFAADLSNGALAASVTDVVIPANSQIIDCVIDVITAASGATNISVGDTVGGAATLVNTFGIGTTAGRKYPTTESGGALAWEDTGTADIRLTVTNSAATSAGGIGYTNVKGCAEQRRGRKETALPTGTEWSNAAGLGDRDRQRRQQKLSACLSVCVFCDHLEPGCALVSVPRTAVFPRRA